MRSVSDTSSAGDDDDAELIIELEMDQLNQHECMSALVSLIRHMQLNAVTPTVEQVMSSAHVNIHVQLSYFIQATLSILSACCVHWNELSCYCHDAHPSVWDRRAL